MRLGLIEISKEPMVRQIVGQPEKKKAYQAPLLEEEAEIAVAYGS